MVIEEGGGVKVLAKWDGGEERRRAGMDGRDWFGGSVESVERWGFGFRRVVVVVRSGGGVCRRRNSGRAEDEELFHSCPPEIGRAHV